MLIFSNDFESMYILFTIVFLLATFALIFATEILQICLDGYMDQKENATGMHMKEIYQAKTF